MTNYYIYRVTSELINIAGSESKTDKIRQICSPQICLTNDYSFSCQGIIEIAFIKKSDIDAIPNIVYGHYNTKNNRIENIGTVLYEKKPQLLHLIQSQNLILN